MKTFMDCLRVGGRLTALILNQVAFTLIGLILYFLYCRSQKKRLRRISAFSRHWARWSCRIMNIRVKVTGEEMPPPGSLIVANHIGMTDIYALGSCFEAVFVSRQDISRWPLIGWTARLGGTVFIDRSKRHKVSEMVSEIAWRLRQDCSVAMFPEGGITDEARISDFKPSAFEAAVIANAAVVPVLIRYHRGESSSIARWGNTNFFTHIFRLMKNRRIDAVLTILPSIRGESNRRVIAERSRQLICQANDDPKNSDAQ